MQMTGFGSNGYRSDVRCTTGALGVSIGQRKKGHKALHFTKDKVHALFGELFDGRAFGPRI
jgi:hypothetical protein